MRLRVWFARRVAYRHKAILDALAAGELSGYDLTSVVGRGPGSVYPDLELLDRAGLVVSRWGAEVCPGGPRRRMYSRRTV